MKRWFAYPTVAVSAAVILLAGPAFAAPPPPIVVTNTVANDTDDAPTAGSLRWAILQSNASVGVKDTINFNIPTRGPGKDPGCDEATGVCMVAPLYLPGITDPVVIDGYSQPGASPATETDPAVLKVVVSVSDSCGEAISIASGNTTVKGLVLFGQAAAQISLSGSGNVVEGNYIGTDATGKSAGSPSSASGVLVASSDNTIGGTTPAARNVISSLVDAIVVVGTPSGNKIQGNYIGTDASGALSLGNGNSISIAGGTKNTVGPGNVIAGSSEAGIFIYDGFGSTTENVVKGNFIGTDKSGTAALPNKFGVHLSSSVADREVSGNVIGGETAVDRNVISGNTEAGVLIEGASAKNNVIKGNYIGTNKDGTGALGNEHGVWINAAADNLVGGDTPGARNIISGNTYHGVYLYGHPGEGASRNAVKGNYIGTDKDGGATLGNTHSGVVISTSSDNMIGGASPGTGNIISGNGSYGVYIACGVGTCDRNLVQGNLIGTDKDGVKSIGNGDGGLYSGGSENAIGGTEAGTGNVIAHNLGPGVVISGSPLQSAIKNRILANSIHSNGGLGIDLGGDGVTPNDAGDADIGANNLQNFPVITSAYAGGGTLTVTGSLNSYATSGFTIEFFSNSAVDPSGYGEGEKYLGRILLGTDDSGNISFSAPLSVTVPAGHFITAIATQKRYDSSEFSKAVMVYAEPIAPTTSITLAGTAGSNDWYRSDVKVTVSAQDNPGGTGVAETRCVLDPTSVPANFDALPASCSYMGTGADVTTDGTHVVYAASRDVAGNKEAVVKKAFKIDKTKPTVEITYPTMGARVQDGTTFKATLTDPAPQSGPASLSFSLREPNGTLAGKVVGTGEFEDMAAIKGTGNEWTLLFNTYIPPKLPDGPYLLFAKGFDVAGNSGEVSVSFFIANWATLDLLPGKGNYNSGKTVPIKFSLRVNALVDPSTPFVHNEQLTIKIYEKGKPTPILQTSTYGTGNADYRIDDAAKQYIVNFQTGKSPTSYVVEVWRKTLKIGSFEFQTVK